MRAMVLHQREPLELVTLVGDVFKEEMSLALEDAQNAKFLLRP